MKMEIIDELRNGEELAFNDKILIASHLRKFINKFQNEEFREIRILIYTEFLRFYSISNSSILGNRFRRVVENKVWEFYSNPNDKKLFDSSGAREFIIDIFGYKKAYELCGDGSPSDFYEAFSDDD